MSKKRVCETCGSKRFFKISGNIQCEEGHLVRYIQESNESQETSRFATQTRRKRKNKEKKASSSNKPNSHFHGRRADFLKWQCLQWILRQQIRVMIDDLGYPKELEVIAKDLWALMVASNGITDGPSDFHLGEEGEESYSGTKETGTYIKRKKRKLERGEEESEEESENEEERRRREAPSSDEDEDDPPKNNSTSSKTPLPSQAAPKKRPRIEKIEDENMNPYDLPIPKPPVYTVDRSTDPHVVVSLDHTLIVIYLSCISLKLPVFFSDIIKLAEEGKIPFFHVRYFLPQDMQRHLNLADSHFFDPSTIRRINSFGTIGVDGGLGLWIAKFTKMYLVDWGVRFPEYNMPLMTWRICQSLGCSPIFYTSLRTLLSLLPPLTFTPPIYYERGKRVSHPAQLNPSKALPPFSDRELNAEAEPLEAEQVQTWDKRYMEPFPEMILVSALVVLVKLIYGGDEESLNRLSSENNDILLCLPSLRDWICTLTKLASSTKDQNTNTHSISSLAFPPEFLSNTPPLGSVYIPTDPSSIDPVSDIAPLLISHIFSILDLSLDNPLSLLPIIAEIESLLVNRNKRATRNLVGQKLKEEAEIADQLQEQIWQREKSRRMETHLVRPLMRAAALESVLIEVSK